MTMGCHKLTAGDGYQYLTRQTAVVDASLAGGQRLEDYYSEKGERPGTWLGSGLAALGGIEAGDTVTSEQMRALFGEGRHPDAERLEEGVRQAGGTLEAQDKASRLGYRFRRTTGDPARFVVECSRSYEAYNKERGLPRTAPIPSQERSAIRSRIARELFAEEYGRPPAEGGELDAFVARESRPRQQACAGYDLTFSPVKSVSTLWAIADMDTTLTIQDAHDAAVADTLSWLEREVIYTRRGADGVRTVDVTGLLATAFTHRDSRAGDPDLHTHVAVANKVRDPIDGAWLSVDGQVLYKHIVAASERYNTRLEVELTARLGVAWRDVESTRQAKRNVREIVGVDTGLMGRWSQRRTMIDARLAELSADFQVMHGRVPTSKEALDLAQQATLETREGKKPHRSWADQREQWRAEAQTLLGGVDQVDAMLAASVPGVASTPDVPVDEGLAAAIGQAAVDVIEEERAVFQVAHLRAEVERQTRSHAVPRLHVDQVVDAAVRHGLDRASVRLDDPDERAVPVGLQRADGTSQYRTPGAQLFTTAAVIEAEERIVAAAGLSGARVVSDLDLAVGFLSATANGTPLNEGQRRMVTELGGSGARLQLALAPAGTGKTTAMRALAEAWRTGGGTVLGLAPSAVAAVELGTALGSRGETLAKLRWDLESGVRGSVFDQVDAGTLIVVDEAGMASTRDLARLVALAEERGATVRLIGDDQQLAAVGAGGVCRDIATRHGAATLSEVVRFSVPGEAEAGLALREGRAIEALGFYLDQSRVVTASAIAAEDTIYAAWSEDRDAGLTSLMIAGDNNTVVELNGRARAERLARTGGTAGRSAVLDSGLEVSAGDTIVTRWNRRDLRLTRTDFVKNHDRWSVAEVLDDGALVVDHERTRRRIVLPADYVSEHVELGYATTAHGAQGQTVDTAYTLLRGQESRQLAYVALTRGRDRNVAVVPIGGDGDAHNAVHADQVIPKTAAEILQGIFERDGSAQSAGSTAQTLTAPQTQLRTAAAVYTDAVGRTAELLAGPERLATLATTADELVPGLSDARSWPQLAQHLITRELAGDAAVELLERARDQRPLDDARDPAALLLWRLDPQRVTGPLPWLPATPNVLAADAEHGPWLVDLAHQVRDAADQVRSLAREWTPETAPTWARRFLADPSLVSDLAVWRAANEVDPLDPRPAGPPPSGRFERRQHTRLTKRASRSDSAESARPVNYWANHLDLAANVLHDPWWPVLATRLDELAADPALSGAVDSQVPPTVPDDDPATEAPPTPSDPRHEDDRPRGYDADETPRDPDVHARTVAANTAAAEFYRACRPGSWAEPYLEQRGLAAVRDKLGYAPAGPRALVDHLLAGGYDEDTLVDAGLAQRGSRGQLIDRFRDRLMFPITTLNDHDEPEIVAFTGRAAETARTGTPKYLNTPTTDSYHKSEVLYGLAENLEALRAGAVPVIVEGTADAEAVTLASGGTAIGLAPCGTALTGEQVDALAAVVDLTSTQVVGATDQDESGRKAAVRAWHLFRSAGAADPRALRIERKDPGDVLRYDGPDTLRAALAHTGPLLGDVVTQRITEWGPVLDHIDGQLGLLRSLVDEISEAPPEQRDVAIAQLLVRLDLDAEVIYDELDPQTHDADATDQAEAGVTAAPAAPVGPSDTAAAELVARLVADAAVVPLPAEQPAAALWSRLQATMRQASISTPTGGSRAAERQLVESGLDARLAAALLITAEWPEIVDAVASAERDGDRGALADALATLDDPDVTEADQVARAVLDHLDPPVAARPDRTARPTTDPTPPGHTASGHARDQRPDAAREPGQARGPRL